MKDGDRASTAIAEVKTWIEGFVSQPHPRLGNFPPCPYARKFLLQNKVVWKVCFEKTHLEALLEECSQSVLADSSDVGIVICPFPKEWHPKQLERFVNDWRSAHLHRDLYLMRDHPDDLEIVNDVKMNQGHHLLFFIQRHSALTLARRELKDQGYYSKWTAEQTKEMTGDLT